MDVAVQCVHVTIDANSKSFIKWILYTKVMDMHEIRGGICMINDIGLHRKKPQSYIPITSYISSRAVANCCRVLLSNSRSNSQGLDSGRLDFECN